MGIKAAASTSRRSEGFDNESEVEGFGGMLFEGEGEVEFWGGDDTEGEVTRLGREMFWSDGESLGDRGSGMSAGSMMEE